MPICDGLECKPEFGEAMKLIIDGKDILVEILTKPCTSKCILFNFD